MIESDLRLSDLNSRKGMQTKLMNVQIPETLSTAIDELSEQLGCTKTAAIIALLNEGLDAVGERRGEFPPLATKRVRRGRPALPLPERPRDLARSKK